ncbi:MAG: diguanylate cyclase [Rhizobacter sp.]|nr:diguanylate cyclase [Rhizobacter sp.]
MISLAQTFFAAGLMLVTLHVAPPVGGLMLMSLITLISMSAIQLDKRWVIALCIVVPLISVMSFAINQTFAGVPTSTRAEQVLTSAWLLWLMLKASANNVEGTRLRKLVSQANQELAEALSEVEKVAATDELTVLPNRRSIMRQLSLELEGVLDTRRSIGVALLDIDKFKAVNDTYGHDVGDQVLRAFANVASANLRPDDRLGRYGGEEFLLMLVGIDGSSAFEVTERMRAGVESYPWDLLVPGLTVTLSAGVTIAVLDEAGASAINRADAALYQAKLQGRNRVVFASQFVDLPLPDRQVSLQ